MKNNGNAVSCEDQPFKAGISIHITQAEGTEDESVQLDHTYNCNGYCLIVLVNNANERVTSVELNNLSLTELANVMLQDEDLRKTALCVARAIFLQNKALQALDAQ